MALRKISFKEPSGGLAIELPVTPESFTVQYGQNVAVINIHSMGDVALAGYPECGQYSIDALLPSVMYPFVNKGAKTSPSYYTEQFKKWMKSRTVLQYIIPDTKINVKVYITGVSITERDGTNDQYMTLSMREYRQLSVSTGEYGPTSTKTVTVKKGDTLKTICQKYYRQKSLYKKLASFNKIKNPSTIKVGKKIKVPPRKQL